MSRYSSPHGVFHIDPLPGQPQIAHCHGLFVFPEYRSQGYGHAIKAAQARLLSELGFDFATCTVDSTNAAQLTVLKRAGWSFMSSFHNSRTNTTTQVWGFEIKSKRTEQEVA